MKISNINSLHIAKPVFKGLWGEPQNDTVADYDCIYSHTDEFYYPFKDETNEQTNNTSKQLATTNNINQTNQIIRNIIKINVAT